MRVRVVTAAAAVAFALAAGAPQAAAEPQVGPVDNTAAIDPGDGSLPDGAALTPFDVQDPAIGRLDPRLLTAIQDAATAAAADGVTMTITSGWRTPQFQQQLLDN